MGTLVSGRLSVAAGCLGVIEDCLIESVRYAKEREQHGKAIGKHQLVQEHLTAIEMHRLATDALVYQAAAAKDAAATDAAMAAKADLLAAQAKLYASNAAWDAADRASKSSAAAAGRRFTALAATCKMSASAASTKGRMRF